MKSKKIGKYEVQSVIGEGSFGKVYLASVENSSDRVALKFINKKNRTSKQINSLKSETQLLTKIQHDNVIAMKECFETDHELIVVMEYAGADLSKLLEKEKKLSEDKVRFFGRQILAAMLYLHQNRILHRDLKPQNILLQHDQIKICDFGFAKKMSASTNFLMSIKGTPLYIAPEILQSMKYTHKVDIWSLGIILYELATGRTPFYASTIQQLQPKILHETVKFPQGMSIYLRELIDGMLQKTPSKRYDWDQVKNHKFFTMQSVLPANEVVNIGEVEDKPKIPLKWNCEEECAELMRLQSQFAQGKLQVRDLKYNDVFCLSVTRLLGQACIDRSKVPKEVLIKTLRLVTKMAMSKSDTKQVADQDIARNKTLALAVISLGLEQTDDDLLEAELELVGFLLKQNFYGVKIDSDYDQEIPTLISKQLSRNCSKPCANLCFKIFGILANQAITAFSESEEFFTRIVEAKLLTVLASKYSPAPQNAIVLESLQKILHPRLERTSVLTHKTKLLFRTLRQQCASTLLSKGLITDQSPLSRHWLKPNDLEIYLSTLLQCLSVSSAVRGEFLKKGYWKELLSNRKTKLYYIAYCYIVLKEQGVYLLNRVIIQNEIVQDEFDNKLCNLYLVYFAFHDLSTHPAKSNKAVRNLIKTVKTLLLYDQDIKVKNSKEFFGFFSEDSKYFDTLLIDILHALHHDLRSRDTPEEQQILLYCEGILEDSLKLPLSEHSLLQILQLQTNPASFNEQTLKRIDAYFLDMLQKEGFEDLLTANSSECTALLTLFLELQTAKLTDDRQIANMAELLEKYQLLRFIFSEQVLNEQLFHVTLKIVNKTVAKLKSIDFLANAGVQAVKKYQRTKSEDLQLQIVSFCCNLARIKQEYCHDLLESGIVAPCYHYLDSGNEILKQKTLLLIGNLSKHNNAAFDRFEQHHIVTGIYRCIAQCKTNKKILKNTIYAIGNISYYSERFAQEIKPIIVYILEGLFFVEDDHILINTISTISNLLRHTSVYLTTLIETGTIRKIIDIFAKSINPDVANYCCSLLKKAVAFPEFSRHFKKQQVRKVLEGNIKKGVLKADLDSVKRLRQILV